MRRALCLLAIATAALPAYAEVVQLTRPRETTLILQPGSTRALVRETRALQLPAGVSALSFSWNGGTVDGGSIGLTLDRGTVGDVTRPPGRDRTLVWQVTMPDAGAVCATVSYFLDGVKWQPSYELVLDAAAGEAVLEASVRLTNETGAPLRQVALRIAAPGSALTGATAATDQSLGPAAVASVEPGATVVIGLGPVAKLPVTLRTVYQAERSGDVQQMLKLAGEQAALLARQWPNGPMLIQHAGDPQTPLVKASLDLQLGKDFEVALGVEPEIVVERKLMASKRGNFDFDRFGKVAGLDTTEEVLIQVRNHLGRDVTLEVIEPLLSTWDLKGPEPVKKETNSVQWSVPVAAGGVAELEFSLVKHAGTRAKK